MSTRASTLRPLQHSLGVLLCALALSFAACARQPDRAQSSPSNPNAAPAASQPTAAPAAAAAAPPSAGDLTAAAKTQQEGTDSGASDSNEAALERVAALPPQGRLPAGKWAAGTNYTVLVPAQPSDAPPGKVEVDEMFWYGCPHCNAFDPTLENWRKHKPSYINFVRIPVMWSEIHRAHARLFYTLQALGKLDELHTKVFAQIHQNGDELYVSGNEQATLAAQLKFAEANGISEAAFMSAYNSFAVQTDLQRADDLGRRYKIDAVPTIVIDGKYESNVGMAGDEDKLIELIDDLAASEKHGAG